ncbi:MAG: CPBP family intramembrane metalloprotease [Armatimonadetes bacterium]|nr:CPBP family intramembrane metalloprotease [Armatimonadota bacterium]
MALNQPRCTDDDSSWLGYLLVIGLIVGALVALNLLVTGSESSGRADELSVSAMKPPLVWLVSLLVTAGILGFVLIIIFFKKYGRSLRYAPRPRVQSSVLLVGFLAYFLTYFILSAFAGIVTESSGITESDASAYLLLHLMAMLGGFAAGMGCLWWLTSHTHEDVREIGLRINSVVKEVGWGIAAYCAALPPVGTAALITYYLSKNLLRNIQTPEHPIVRQAADGGAAMAMAFILAVLAAPIVEETFFRGFLYTALRMKMGVWAATLLSATIFAVIHPTFPGQFLMLFALACVLALTREKTGSLLPCIICHAINNGVTMLVMILRS